MTSTPSSSTATPRAPFSPEPVLDTTFSPHHPSSQSQSEEEDVVESPSLSSSNALARFEFESGTPTPKTSTKILLVEWEDSPETALIPGDWEISWSGKQKTIFPTATAREDVPKNGIHRLYFLLGPGLPVPATVELQKGNGAVRWKTNPLPAIFSPDLGMSATQAGKKGVLHTIWAKKRLQVLRGEIEYEERRFGEGVALEMAVAEMEWIERNFGVGGGGGEGGGRSAAVEAGPGGSGLGISTSAMSGVVVNSPASPRSPGGGKLMDKLKGLKLGTSEKDLSSPIRAGFGDVGAPPPPANNPLSPESSDVAVGSFNSFAALKGMPPPSDDLAAKPAQPPAQRKFAAQSPPESFAAQQRQQQGGSGMGSLNAFAASSEVGFSQGNSIQGGDGDDDDDDDDLFALPMSPRSPEMSKSPFSFAVQDTNKYAQGERAA